MAKSPKSQGKEKKDNGHGDSKGEPVVEALKAATTDEALREACHALSAATGSPSFCAGSEGLTIPRSLLRFKHITSLHIVTHSIEVTN